MQTITIYGENRHENFTKTRVSCRGLVIHDSMVLMCHELYNDFWSTSGGGLEEGETYEECCAREILEETGYTVKIQEHFLTVEEYYDEWRFINYFFVCEICKNCEKRKVTLTETEKARNLKAEWINFNRMYDIFSKYEDFKGINDEKMSSYLRDYAAFREYLNCKNTS